MKIMKEKIIDVDRFDFISPRSNLSDLICTLCGEEIGTARPIAIIFGSDGGGRLCNDCAQQLPHPPRVDDDQEGAG